ncbi:hypothetical protein E4U56_003143 [Claviceps arundinis]|uniref:Cx9C motif-containing protein 4, mitochondrial n=1 Tax=Claviceps arundinis TaxID=1623583 RepID=A0A9P7MZ16_9HYPO|nr:hypothetical protein E4U56_003143 [Claviceps arundinis]
MVSLQRHVNGMYFMNPQDCLARNNYDDAKCQHVIMALYECCHAFYQRHGEDARTPSCPKPDVLRLKLQHTKDGK